MKRHWNKMLMALLVIAFSVNLTSCKDDDNDEQRRADAETLDTQEAQTAWRWLCALTNEQTLSDNWTQKTYECQQSSVLVAKCYAAGQKC
jgi:hypothetical protein